MKALIWAEFLERDDLKTCTLEDLEKEEKEIGFTLPDTLKKMMMEHGGQYPENLIPKYPNGHDMLIDCLYHAFSDDDEDHSYTISSSTSCLADEDYINYVSFGNVGNVFLVLDYNVRKTNPPVVIIMRDSIPEDPDHRHLLADNFDQFLEKYTV